LRPHEWKRGKKLPHAGPVLGTRRLIDQLMQRLPGLEEGLARDYVYSTFDVMREALLAGEKVSIRGFAVWYPKGMPRKDGRHRNRQHGRGVTCRTSHALRLAVDPTHAQSTYYTRWRGRRARDLAALCLGACLALGVGPTPTFPLERTASSSGSPADAGWWRLLCGKRWRALSPLPASYATAALGRLIPGEGCPSGWRVSRTTSISGTTKSSG